MSYIDYPQGLGKTGHTRNELEKRAYLSQLCQPLNVEPEYNEESFNELQTTLDQQSEKLDTVESDLHDYKTKCEELEEKIGEFSEWLKEVEDTDGVFMVKVSYILKEYKKTFGVK